MGGGEERRKGRKKEGRKEGASFEKERRETPLLFFSSCSFSFTHVCLRAFYFFFSGIQKNILREREG